MPDTYRDWEKELYKESVNSEYDKSEFLSDGFHIETHAYKSKLYQEAFPNDTPEHAAIKVLSRSGFSNRQIATFFKISHTAVANILRRE